MRLIQTILDAVGLGRNAPQQFFPTKEEPRFQDLKNPSYEGHKPFAVVLPPEPNAPGEPFRKPFARILPAEEPMPEKPLRRPQAFDPKRMTTSPDFAKAQGGAAHPETIVMPPPPSTSAPSFDFDCDGCE